MTLSAKWIVKQNNPDEISKLAEALGVREVTAACLINRGIKSPSDAQSFFSPRLSNLKPPDKLADLALGADRLADAIIRNERIAVFGDYDVDGISSAALITSLIKGLGSNVDTLIADRFLGYGMSEQHVDHFLQQKCTLIIAVDCGTSDHAAILHAKEAGIDVIVIDHHRVEGQRPDAYAFINPERKDCEFNDTTHAAVGIAFYFASAVRNALCKKGHIQREDLDLLSLLDLVALGTVADVMPLCGNNRILVSFGLKQMSKAPREGIRSLIRIARLRSSSIRADHIAYHFAPRLNAAGRLENAKEAFDLLVAETPARAFALAGRLDDLSKQRKILEEEVLKAAKEQIDRGQFTEDRVILVFGDGWHKGVLGIVASRLLEWTGKPSYVVGFSGEHGSGSARCAGQLDLHESLATSADCLNRYGGHKDAAGFSLNIADVKRFKTSLENYAMSHWMQTEPRQLICDSRLPPNEISHDLFKEISMLGPFGAQNEEPVFEVDGLYVLEKRVVGNDHIKIQLKTPSGTIGAFGPRMASIINEIPVLIKVAASISTDEWRGDGTPELRLVAPPVAGS